MIDRKRVTAQSLKVRADNAKESLGRKMFLALCLQRGVPAPVPQYRFAAPDRQFAFDYAWPDARVALEVQGGIWNGGGHSGGRSQLRDMEKFNLGVVRHWRILQCQPSTLCTDETITMIQLALQPTPALTDAHQR